MAVLQNLHSELETWKSEVCQQIAPPEGHEMTPDEKDEYFVQVAKSRAELFNHLKKAVALRVKGKLFRPVPQYRHEVWLLFRLPLWLPVSTSLSDFLLPFVEKYEINIPTN